MLNTVRDNRALRRLWATAAPALAVLAVQQAFFGVPAGIFVRGIVIGLLTAMVSVGMALIYRANRVLNFAQADLGFLPATLSVMLSVTRGVPWLLALLAGLAASIALGAVCELAIVRRFFRAPRLVLTVATLGLSQLLSFGGLLLPRAFGEKARSQRIEPPFDWTFQIDPIVFNANDVLTLVVAPLAIVGVGIFLQRTAVGVAIRAAADRADRASLLGVPVKGLHTIVWGVAGALAFTGIFLRAGVIGLPIGLGGLSFGLLLRSLAALMLGRMTHIPTIALSAVALGVLEMGVDWNGLPFMDQESPLLVEPVVAMVVVVALLLRRRDVTRLETDGVSTWLAADEVRPIPRELRRLPEVRLVTAGVLALTALFVLVLPHLLATNTSLKVSVIVIWSLIAASVMVVTGWAGQISLAQIAFYAVGAVAGGWLTKEQGLDLLLALPLAGIAGAVAAVLVGLPALRLKGLFLAVTTLGFGLAASNWLLNKRFFDFVPSGRIERPELLGRVSLDSATSYYYFVVAVTAVMFAMLLGVRRSRTGRVLIALRENERGVQAYGVSVVRAKITAFAISGFVAAVGGCLFVHHQQAYDESSYGPFLSIIAFTAAVIGGVGSLLGAVVGATYSQGSFYLLKDEWRLFASALGTLFVLLVLPGGLGSLLYKVRDAWLRNVANRHEIVVPSMVADLKVDPPPEPTLEQAAELVETQA